MVALAESGVASTFPQERIQISCGADAPGRGRPGMRCAESTASSRRFSGARPRRSRPAHRHASRTSAARIALGRARPEHLRAAQPHPAPERFEHAGRGWPAPPRIGPDVCGHPAGSSSTIFGMSRIFAARLPLCAASLLRPFINEALHARHAVNDDDAARGSDETILGLVQLGPLRRRRADKASRAGSPESSPARPGFGIRPTTSTCRPRPPGEGLESRLPGLAEAARLISLDKALHAGLASYRRARRRSDQVSVAAVKPTRARIRPLSSNMRPHLPEHLRPACFVARAMTARASASRIAETMRDADQPRSARSGPQVLADEYGRSTIGGIAGDEQSQHGMGDQSAIHIRNNRHAPRKQQLVAHGAPCTDEWICAAICRGMIGRQAEFILWRAQIPSRAASTSMALYGEIAAPATRRGGLSGRSRCRRDLPPPAGRGKSVDCSPVE